jgi:DNA-binding NarL/FixJ family response regulator
MNILLNLSSYLFSKALNNLLDKEEGYEILIVDNRNTPEHVSKGPERSKGEESHGFRPNIILVDFNSINPKLLSQYPESKVILIDTGLKQENIIAALISYRLSGVLSAHTDIPIFKKALKIVSEGQIWIDNSTIKAFLQSARLISKTGKINGITEREKEIIEHISQGYRNKEIAQRLNISEQTVKAHLNSIFRKFNVSSRSKLITLATNNRIA